MDLSQLGTLSPATLAVVATSAALVSGFFLLFAAPIASIPGFRDADATRSAFLRVAHGLLALILTIGLAWSQNVVIPRSDFPALLAQVVIASGALNGIYIGAKALLPLAPGTQLAPATLAPDAPAVVLPPATIGDGTVDASLLASLSSTVNTTTTTATVTTAPSTQAA